MEEYFSWWNLPFQFLFYSWEVSSTTALVFTSIAIFCVAILYEAIRVITLLIHKKHFALPLKVVATEEQSGGDDLPVDQIEVPDSVEFVKCQRKKNHYLQTLVHIFKVILSYGLMLAIMTFNGYIAMAIILGATFGYYIFCHKLEDLVLTETNHEEDSFTRSTTAVSPDPSIQSLIAGPSSAQT